MTKNAPGKALIIGGGIAGSATAVALARAGIDAEVFEARDASSDGAGAFLTLAVNGVAALRLIGVDVAGLPDAFPTPELELGLGSGRRLARFPLGPRLPDGSVTHTIARASLYGALRAAARDAGVVVHHGRRLRSAEVRDGTVVACFDDGSEAVGDLLIGADGLHSETRRLIDPDAPPKRYLGILNTAGVARGVRVPGPPGTMMMTFGKRAFFAYVARGDGEVWWFANPPHRGEPTRAELAARSGAAWRDELVRLFGRDRTPAAELIAASDDVLAPWATYDLPGVSRWSRDRMLVIGDAAHAASPSSGQGASMAVEDAVALARALRDAPTVEAALAEYERVRRPRVERVVAQGKASSDDKVHGPLGRVVRDVALRVVFARPPEHDLDWMYTDFPLEG